MTKSNNTEVYCIIVPIKISSTWIYLNGFGSDLESVRISERSFQRYDFLIAIFTLV